MKDKLTLELSPKDHSCLFEELDRIQKLNQKIKITCLNVFSQENLERAWQYGLNYHFNHEGDFLFADIYTYVGYPCVFHDDIEKPTMEALLDAADIAKDYYLQLIGDVLYRNVEDE